VDQPLSQIKRLKFMNMTPHRLLLLPVPSILAVDFVRRRSTNVVTQPIPAFIGLAVLLADLAL
jgi:hypothetical protein